MANTFSGKATFFGVAGADNIFSGYATYQKASFKDDFDKKMIKDANGVDVGEIAYNTKREITIDLIIAADTNAHAATGLAACIPARLAPVTLSTFALTQINAVWMYEGGATVEFINDDIAKISLPLVRHETDISNTPA